MLFAADYMDPDDVVNYCAKMSCPKWNRSLWEPKTRLGEFLKKIFQDNFYKLSRQRYRKKYWAMAQKAWESGERQFWIKMLGEHGRCSNTYPWPYCSYNFADWKEEPDALVFDPSGCIVKDSTSYCAWKIYECTGKWPNEGLEFHTNARNWQYFLEKAGYEKSVLGPENLHHYVAIDPNDGKKGVVLWFEHVGSGGSVITTAYKNRCHNIDIIKPERVFQYIWMRID